jgi:hypothetical protein
MAITTLAGCVSGMRPFIDFHKATATAEGASTWHSLWKVAGFPAAGANPPAYTVGSGYVPTSSTLGSFPYVNPASGESVLAYLSATGGVAGTLILYDRLWAISGLTTAAAATLSVTSPGVISRGYDGYVGTELWGEVYVAPGATAATWTVAYTDQSGNAGTATYAHPANAETAGQMFPFTLADGDTGVQAVTSFTTSTTSGTAGDIGLTILRRIAEIPLAVCTKNSLDAVALGMPVLINNPAIAMMIQCTGTATGNVFGKLAFSQG